MYFALTFIFALAIVALVLFLEQRGDPRMLEREYDADPTLHAKAVPRKKAS